MDSLGNSGNSGNNWGKSNKIISIVFTGIIFALIIYFLVIVSKDYTKYSKNNPYLIRGTKIGKTGLVVPGSKINRSIDGKYGLEFTYSMWLYVEDSNFSTRKNTWKHIMHKGTPSTAMPLQSPGIWLYPSTNKLAINMNTYHSVKESCDIANIPLNKWFHLTIMVIGNSIDVYINCNLKKRCKFKGIPKLNYGDLHVNTIANGFDGFISNLRYWDKSISSYQIQNICKEGPSKAPCTDTGVNPPYLSKNYWMNTGFPNTVYDNK
jgi:hypothetical protein